MADSEQLVYGVVEDLRTTYSEGEARFWVNDHGRVLNGKITESIGFQTVPCGDVKDYVGIVDETVGGMIYWAAPDEAEKLATMLNKLDAIEKIAASPNR